MNEGEETDDRSRYPPNSLPTQVHDNDRLLNALFSATYKSTDEQFFIDRKEMEEYSSTTQRSTKAEQSPSQLKGFRTRVPPAA
jgi:hypothetical protein